jgi:hypothetical protein
MEWMHHHHLSLILAFSFPLALTACSCGEDGGGGGSGSDSGVTTFRDAVIGPDAPGSELCPEGCECTDGVDNDGDGLVDGMDPECTGPFDNDEGSFATGIPGDNRDPFWQDCFYDGNSGAGDDNCRYHTECLTGERDSSDPSCEVTASCLEFCRPRTPNGCDCFGCCEVTLDDGSTIQVRLNDRCTIDDIENETLCPRCVADDACNNDCGTCELCYGRTAEDLPPECYPEDGGVPMYTCDDGVACMSDADCADGGFCSLGCCLAAPI